MDYIEKNLHKLEEVINVKFDNINLLRTAITHSSYANEHSHQEFNERLEFLGDSVLQLCISEYLFKKYSKKPEGELTKIRATIVCENSLHEIALKWNLGEFMIMSKGEEYTGGRTRVSILADCVEAVISAVFLDKGIDASKKLIYYFFDDIIEKAGNNQIILDYKTKLQEILQQNGEVPIEYVLTGLDGPAHHRKFFTEVKVANKKMGFGVGYSKKASEQNAAKEALKSLENQNE